MPVSDLRVDFSFLRVRFVRDRVFLVFFLNALDTATQLRTLREVVFGIDPLLLSEARHDVLRPKANRVNGTRFLTKTTKHAAQNVDFEPHRIFLDGVFRMLPRLNVNTLRRTICGAKETSRTSDISVVTQRQKMLALEPLTVGRGLLGPFESICLLTSRQLVHEGFGGERHLSLIHI